MIGGKTGDKRAYKCARTNASAKRKGETCSAPAIILADVFERYCWMRVFEGYRDAGSSWGAFLNGGDVDLKALENDLATIEARIEKFANPLNEEALGDRYAEKLRDLISERDTARQALQDGSKTSALPLDELAKLPDGMTDWDGTKGPFTPDKAEVEWVVCAAVESVEVRRVAQKERTDLSKRVTITTKKGETL
jgi:hypothetical protein